MAKDFVQMDLLEWVSSFQELADQYKDIGFEPCPARSFNEQMRHDIAARDGVSTKCKHLSIWNKHVCNNCRDCYDFSSEESIALRRHPDTGTDGVTRDRFECLNVPLPGKIKAMVEIRLSYGNSGSWYYGLHLNYAQAGMAFSPLPKFSDKYATRYSAFLSAAKDSLAWFIKNKVKPAELRIIQKMIIDTANYSGLVGVDPKALEG
jgi:hypothetical protein